MSLPENAIDEFYIFKLYTELLGSTGCLEPKIIILLLLPLDFLSAFI